MAEQSTPARTDPVQRIGGADFVGSRRPDGWLVCGWFTPDYRPRAEILAAQLQSHSVPHHLLAVDKIGNWSREVLRKPTMIQRAMREHPHDTIVFMDVDCMVTGRLDGIAETRADVTCTMYVKRQLQRLRTELSSRVVILRPTAECRNLVHHWILECQEAQTTHPDQGDETALMIALSRCPGAAWSAIEPRFAGREHTKAPHGAVIVHDSANDSSTPMKRAHKHLKAWKRSVFGSTTKDLALK